MVTAANRGKYAEGKVKAELKKLEGDESMSTANFNKKFPLEAV